MRLTTAGGVGEGGGDLAAASRAARPWNRQGSAVRHRMRPQNVLDAMPGCTVRAAEAGRTAERAGAERLPVTHVGPSLRPEEAPRRAAADYAGPVAYAGPRKTCTVG
ncbi:hypothetical protein GCM10009834_44840 [Streptomonospora arabica]